MHVHAGPVLLVERLWHERRALARLAGDVLDDVLLQLRLVGDPQQRVEPDVDLCLSGRTDLVVLELAVDAHLLQRDDHARPQVAVSVHRRGREVALLRTHLVAEVRACAVGVGAEARAPVPVRLGRVDLVERGVRALIERDVIEDVELGFGPHVTRVGDPRREQVALRLDRHVARVARVGLTRDRVDDVADDRQRLLLVEGVDDRGPRVWHEDHVGLRDLLEAADRRAVEAEAVGERVLVERVDRQAEVLPGTREVGELEVDHPHTVGTGEVEHVAGPDAAPGDVAARSQRGAAVGALLEGGRRAGQRISSALASTPSADPSPAAPATSRSPGTRLTSSSNFIPVRASSIAGRSATICVTSLVIREAPTVPPPLPPIITMRSVLASGAETAAASCGSTSSTRSVTAASL